MPGWLLEPSSITFSSAEDVAALYSGTSPKLQLNAQFRGAQTTDDGKQPQAKQADKAVVPAEGGAGDDAHALTLSFGESRVLLTHPSAPGRQPSTPGNIDTILYTGEQAHASRPLPASLQLLHTASTGQRSVPVIFVRIGYVSAPAGPCATCMPRWCCVEDSHVSDGRGRQRVRPGQPSCGRSSGDRGQGRAACSARGRQAQARRNTVSRAAYSGCSNA